MGLETYEPPNDVLSEIRWYKAILEEGTGIRWGITQKNIGVVIGSCGFLNIRPNHYRAEFSSNPWRKRS